MINISTANSTNWEQTTIGESLKLKSGDFLSAANMDTNGKYPVYGGNGITGYHSSYLFENRKIVIGRVGAYCGAVHHTLPYSWITDNALYVAKKDSRLLDEYLVYILRSANLNQYASQSGQPLISEGRLENVKIPLPPLPEQKRIAAILEKCDRLRRTRRYSLQLSETFLQSVFLEMFGDPVTNPKGWKIGTLGDVIVSAKDGPHVSPVYSDSGIPFLSTRNVRKGELIWEDLKFISFEDAKIHWKKCKPERGDILYTKGGTTGLAKAVDFDKEIAVWVHIAVLKLQQDRVISTWLESMLNTDFCYKQSQELTFGIVNRDLGLQRMPKIKIYIPPLPLQEKFAQIVQKHERFRTQQREAQRQAEHLFQTLLHRAFRGELTDK
jgi:type I restriction enzyme S subunit